MNLNEQQLTHNHNRPSADHLQLIRLYSISKTPAGYGSWPGEVGHGPSAEAGVMSQEIHIIIGVSF